MSLIVNEDGKRITVNESSKNLTVTNNDNGEQVTVSQPVTNIVTVLSAGPSGQMGSGSQGPSGSSVDTGSFATTGSNVFVGNQSITGSLNVSLNITSSLFGLATSASYVKNAESASFALKGSGSFSGSFSGSYQGDGSQLTGIVSSKWTGSNPISRNGDVEITGSLNITSGITGSLLGTGSWSISSSHALTSSNLNKLKQNVDLTGSLFLSGSGLFTGSLIVSGTFQTHKWRMTQTVLGSFNQLNGDPQILLVPTSTETNYSFYNDANTGLRWNTFDDISLFTNGISRMRIGSQGNILVGLGSIPSASFAVSGSTIIYNSLTIGKTSTGSVGLDVSGSTNITGSLNVSVGITGSLEGTASIASNVINFKISPSISSGSNKILLFSTGSWTGAFFDYVLTSASNARAGNIRSVWANNTASFSESTTADIGNTLYVTASVILSSSFALLNINIPTNNSWSFKIFYKSI